MKAHRVIAAGGRPTSQRKSRRIAGAAAAALFLAGAPAALHAETNAELAAEIKALKEQIHEMRGLMSATRNESRRTAAKVKAVATRTPAPVAVPAAPGPVGYPAIPAGSTPAFVTADKRLQFGAITITPGGFLAAESFFRSRTINSDIGTNFGSTPFPNSPLGHVGEFRPSARQTRLALLAEGAITPNFFAAGYVEMDFFSAAPTANANQTNSYNPRIRHLYATLDNLDYGLHVLGGQNWSLLTLNSKGITPRNEVTPTTIDNNQHVGSIYARQPQIRLVKDFGRKLWMGVSLEESSTTFNPACGTATGGQTGSTGALTPNPPNAGIGAAPNGNNVTSITCGVVGAGGNTAITNYSLNRIPDVVAKVAYEANIANRDVHLETFGIYTDLVSRVQYTNAAGFNSYANRDTTGYGVGAGMIVPLIPKRLDFQINGLYGRGITRYGPGAIADATYNPDGSLKAVPEFIGLAGLTLHATPSIDIYGYGGIETTVRSYFQSGTNATTGAPNFVGFGSPATNDTTCRIENSAAATCNGTTRTLWQVTAGFWDKLYKGGFGEVRVGAQYSYLKREIFNAPGYGAANITPKTDNHMVFTSLRYYPFQ